MIREEVSGTGCLLKIAKELGIEPDKALTKKKLEEQLKKITEYLLTQLYAKEGEKALKEAVGIYVNYHQASIDKVLYQLRKFIKRPIRPDTAFRTNMVVFATPNQEILTHDQDVNAVNAVDLKRTYFVYRTPTTYEEAKMLEMQKAREAEIPYCSDRFALDLDLQSPEFKNIIPNLDKFLLKYNARAKIAVQDCHRSDTMNIYLSSTVTPDMAKELYSVVKPCLSTEFHHLLDGIEIIQNGQVLKGGKVGPEVPAIALVRQKEAKEALRTNIETLKVGLYSSKEECREMAKYLGEELTVNGLLSGGSLGERCAAMENVNLVRYLWGLENQSLVLMDAACRKYPTQIDISKKPPINTKFIAKSAER